MILTQLRDYLESHGTISQRELAQHFSLSKDGVDAMLQVWIKRGKVSRLVDCSCNGQHSNVRYRWNSQQE